MKIRKGLVGMLAGLALLAGCREIVIEPPSKCFGLEEAAQPYIEEYGGRSGEPAMKEEVRFDWENNTMTTAWYFQKGMQTIKVEFIDEPNDDVCGWRVRRATCYYGDNLLRRINNQNNSYDCTISED